MSKSIFLLPLIRTCHKNIFFTNALVLSLHNKMVWLGDSHHLMEVERAFPQEF